MEAITDKIRMMELYFEFFNDSVNLKLKTVTLDLSFLLQPDYSQFSITVFNNDGLNESFYFYSFYEEGKLLEKMENVIKLISSDSFNKIKEERHEIFRHK